MSLTHVIIGASAAGVAAANKIRQLDSDATIVCISQEAELPYNKCFLADYLSGTRTFAQTTIFSSEQAAQKRITLLLGRTIQTVCSTEKRVQLSDGSYISYDRLLIATGTSPVFPHIQGLHNQGVFAFHGMLHTQELLDAIVKKKPKRAVIIGAGLSGLECADSLVQHGLEVTVVERADQVLNRQLTPKGSCFIEQCMQQLGVKRYISTEVTRIISCNDAVTGVELHDGTCIDTDVVVVAIGSSPYSSLVHGTGMLIQEGRIVVDDTMQTSLPRIYAAGDVVLVRDQLSGQLISSCTWPDALQQGMVTAHNMVGVPKTYPGATVITSSAFFGTKFASCGLTSRFDIELETIEHCEETSYKFFLLHGKRLLGFLIIAPVLNIGMYKRAVLTRQPVDRDQLLAGTIEF